MQELFFGAATAVITPFDMAGKVDLAAFRALVKSQSDTSAIVVCGTTGEGATLSFNEKLSLYSAAKEICDGKIPIIASVGGENVRESARLIKEAKRVGADGALVITPYFSSRFGYETCEDLIYISSSTDMPVILYLVPSRTGITLDAEQCLYINSRSPNVIAVKDADGDFSRSARRIAGIVGKMSVYCGNDDRILAYLSMGARGVISVVSNVFPHPVQEICLSFARGETEKARRIQTALMPIISALFSRTNPMPVKELMSVLGWIYPYARPPLNLTESEGDRLKSIYLQVKEELAKI